MSVFVFGIFFVLGAAAIALWISVRFPQLKPQRLAIIMIHLVVAMVLASSFRSASCCRSAPPPRSS